MAYLYGQSLGFKPDLFCGRYSLFKLILRHMTLGLYNEKFSPRFESSPDLGKQKGLARHFMDHMKSGGKIHLP